MDRVTAIFETNLPPKGTVFSNWTKSVQLRPFTSYKYTYNPIYRMYNPIYNQL